MGLTQKKAQQARQAEYIEKMLGVSPTEAESLIVKPGTPYKHYKTNKVYHVKGIAEDGNAEVDTLYVIYEDSLDLIGLPFIRPLEEFLEKITDTQRRFTKV